MYLPNKEKAIVPDDKILKYLLNQFHPEGVNKTRFFMNWGYSLSNWQLLANALIKHCNQNEITEEIQTKFGLKYTIDGYLETVINKKPFIRTVWFIKNNDVLPILVTAYPIKK